MNGHFLASLALAVAVATAGALPSPQKPPVTSSTQVSKAPVQKPVAPPVPSPPPDYTIGPDDQLSVLFYIAKEMSGEVTVRPDGKISLPLLNDIQAAGLTPDQLRQNLMKEASRFVEDTTVTVVVRVINSRKVFITGSVLRPGPYSLGGTMTVLQLIAVAGGLSEYADQKNITVMRLEGGRQVSFRFNYKEVMQRRNLKQNIELKPGDTVIVP